MHSFYDWLQDFGRGLYYSLLPVRYRSAKPYVHNAMRAGMVCALFEFVLCAVLLVRGYALFMAMRAAQMPWIQGTNHGTQLYMLGILTVEYLFFHPVSFLLLYFTCEGAVRAWSIMFVGTILPTLPLKLAAIIDERRERKRYERGLGPAVPDAVEHLEGEYVLRIASHRPKEGWRESIALSYNGTIYQLARQEQGQPPRSSVYFFRRYPAGQVIRGLYSYDTGASLGAPPPRLAPPASH